MKPFHFLSLEWGNHIMSEKGNKLFLISHSLITLMMNTIRRVFEINIGK